MFGCLSFLVMGFLGMGWVTCLRPAGLHGDSLNSSVIEVEEFFQEPGRIEDVVPSPQVVRSSLPLAGPSK